MTPHGTQNVGLAYTYSYLHMLGGNPSLGNVGGNAPLVTQPSENQGVPSPQKILVLVIIHLLLNNWGAPWIPPNIP